MTGFCDSFRITNGKPRYTANFTPGNLVQDDDTTLLWEFNGSVGQKWVKELSKNTAMIAATNARTVEDGAWLETVLTGANLRVSNSDPKFGAGSMRTDGVAGNYVRVPHRAELCPQGDYTLEAWVKRVGNDAANKIIFGKYSGSYATSSYTLFLDASHRLSMVHYNGGTQYTVTAPTALPLNTWTHVAATMSSGTLRLFVHGTQVGALSSVPAMTISTVPLEIGAQNGGQSPFNGYIDEARISSVARWTSSFTPPTTPYGQTYQTGPFWIATKPDASALDLSAYSLINNATATATTPPGASLKFLISTDDYATALKRWNGSAWVDTAYSMDWNGATLSTSATAAQLDSVGNSAAELQAGLAGMAISAAGTLNIVALLATANPSYSPSLDNLAATMNQYQQLRLGTDYTTFRKKVAGEQTLTVTRVKSGAANHVFDVV